MKALAPLIAAWMLLGAAAIDAREALMVSTDFPSGSGAATIDQDARSIRLDPTPHKDRGWVCWWYVKVSGLVPGETLTLDVGQAPWATPDRAAVSDDNRTWTQTSPGKRDGKRIVYQHRATKETLWFAWGPPFTPDDAEALVKQMAKACPEATAFELCKSRGERPVWAVRFEPEKKTEDTYGIWINARQHAWESGSSWVARGLVEWLASDDDRAQRLRSIAEITVVPIMDIDNVALGAGGKNEVPHDHNRDWIDKPHHPAVAAAQAQIKALNDAGRCDLYLDLHNPGANAKNPFFYTSPRAMLPERGARNLEHFLAAAQADMIAPLAYKGETQESGEQYDKQWQAISKNWVSFHTNDHVVAVTLETAWNTPESTTEGYQNVGKCLGLAVERYLRTSPR
jgi:hypothetical protein